MHIKFSESNIHQPTITDCHLNYFESICTGTFLIQDLNLKSFSSAIK